MASCGADIPAANDDKAERALALRARERRLADTSLCGRVFVHPRRYDPLGCACVLPSGHDGGCVCEHLVEVRVLSH